MSLLLRYKSVWWVLFARYVCHVRPQHHLINRVIVFFCLSRPLLLVVAERVRWYSLVKGWVRTLEAWGCLRCHNRRPALDMRVLKRDTVVLQIHILTGLTRYKTCVVGFPHWLRIRRSRYHHSVTRYLFCVISQVNKISGVNRWDILVVPRSRAVRWTFLASKILLVPS